MTKESISLLKKRRKKKETDSRLNKLLAAVLGSEDLKTVLQTPNTIIICLFYRGINQVNKLSLGEVDRNMGPKVNIYIHSPS
jgi:hypothetical protein